MSSNVHPSIPAQFCGRRSIYGRGTPEHQRVIEATLTMARCRARYIEFMVLDDTAAPRFRSGDLLILDMKHGAFIDGKDYVFDFNRYVGPTISDWQAGMPIRFYPSVTGCGKP